MSRFTLYSTLVCGSLWQAEPSTICAQTITPTTADAPAATAKDDAARAEKLKQRDRMWTEAQKFRDEGKLAAAIESGRKMLTIGRAVLAADSEDLLISINWLADVAEQAEDWAAAEPLRDEVLAWCRKHRGAEHWTTTDARLALEHSRKLESLSAADRADLRRAATLNDDVVRFYREGNLADAVAKGIEVRDLRRRILGENHPDYAASLSNLAVLYDDMGDYARAESLHIQANEIRKRTLGDSHPDYATSLNNLALRYQKMADYARAEPLYRQSTEILKRALGESNPNYAASLNNLALLYKTQGDYARAEPLYLQTIEIGKRTLGENHPNYATSLSNLAELYRTIGDYARAEPLYLQSIEIQKRMLGEDHPDYAMTLNNLAALYGDFGDYARAESLYLQATEIRKRTLGESHPDFAISLNNLAMLYQKSGDYARAEPLYLQTIEIQKRTLGEDHPDYAMTLNNLAVLYGDMGDYARAESLHIQANEIRKRTLGESHPDYAQSLNNLAELYRTIGDYARAEPLYLQTIEIQERTLSEDHPDYAQSLNNLAVLYVDMGDYAQAESLYIQATDIRKRTLGENHPDYAQSLNNLALLYQRMEDYASAEPLYVQTIEIQKRTLGEDHPDYATSLNNLAALYGDMEDYARAESLYLQATEIRKRTLGERHPEYAASLNNLAVLYGDMGDYARAEPLYIQASELWKRTLGENHPDYATSLIGLAFLYAAMDRAAEAEPLYRQALAISRRSLEATAAIQSERQQLAMGWGLRPQLDAYLSLTANSGRYAGDVFREVLLWKGSTLVRQRGMRLAADDPAIADVFTQLQRTATQLASLSRAVPGDEAQQHSLRARVDQLTQDKERLEAQLSAKSATFREATKEISLDDLLAVLPRDAVLVDYLEFDHSTPPKDKGAVTTWTVELVAFVVRRAAKPEDQVRMISLGSVEPVAAAVDRWRTTFGVGEDAAAAGAELRKLVWEPVLKAMNDERGTMNEEPGTKNSPDSPPTTHHSPLTLLVSTDGVLGRMPLAALPGAKPGTYLIEDYRLAMIPVPQLLPALVGGEGSRELDRELLLFGDVDYDATPSAAAADAPKKKQPRRPGDRAVSPTEGRLFDALENTAGEIAAIEKLYGRLFDVNPDDPKSLVRTEADEARFRELAPQYRHLHLATHGFFAGAEFDSAERSRSADSRGDRAMLADRESTVAGYNPGLLSGLALAGANREPTGDADDGILTAQEIGVMNLSGVDTVVLSACDTGLGETAGGEGLLGVQRAFQVAGARTTVASFWKVDDLVTRLLMERFYRNLWEGEMSRLDALREAQLFVLNHPEVVRGSDPQPDDPQLRAAPRLWAAFTLSGDWR